ncbi:MAG: hypothetical protein Q8933_10470 [Bacteroidota bacterium]|nr:hypothetical protein [Bacteroidota bacterium]MDP4190945.1 hypothetical protein [Bacteroidota bacterium]MDP4195370.1 hypothetical protein [Bacteroidota bacterium]
MDLLNFDELKMLTKVRQEPCVSIYIPTHVKGAEIIQDPIRLKNHLREIERDLKNRGYNTLMIPELLHPAYSLLDDDSFWNYMSESLAVFLAKDEFHYYRIPIKTEDRNYISNRFFVKPLLSLINKAKSYYILTLDQKSIRLFKTNPYSMDEIELKDVPQNLAEYIESEQSEQKKYYRSEVGSQNPRFFAGSAAGTDDAKHDRDILRYFQTVDRGVFNIVKEDNIPMVLSGAEFLIPLYREVNSYQNIVLEGITGVPGDIGLEEIFRQSQEIMRPYYEEEETKALTKYGELSNSGRTSTIIGEIVKAAFSKRIETLFINPNVRQWGIFDSRNFEVKLHNNPKEGDEDILELTVVQTLLNGGNVFELDEKKMPKSKAMAAVFRY